MRHLLLPAVLLLLAACGAVQSARTASATTGPKAGDLLWRLDLSDPARLPSGLPAGAAWVEEGPAAERCLRITVPADRAKGMAMVSIPVDVAAWRGMVVSIACQAKAEGVSQPPQPWNGVKCMLHYRSASSGDAWVNEGKVFGTFGWRQLSASASIADDASDGEIMLGMQDCSGTAWIADVRITAQAVRPRRPAPQADAPPPFRGHDLPRLRGVMSPNSFAEKDFTDLAAMGVNAVRWQIGRNWGKTGGDRDIAEYDRWLDAEMAELDQALEAGKRHGIRLLIDLHAPPGGRLPDGTMSMLLEKAFQDHFVAVWERFARRYRGHPAVWGYDLVNEPVQNRPSPPGLADWLGIQVLAGKAIRRIDADTPIVIETDAWDNPQRFAWLEPVDLPKVIYQAHMYWPGEYTHQGVHNAWGEQGSAARPVYPGTFNGRPLDRAALAAYLKPVREFQLAYNAHIIIGEFSAVRWAGGADRYLADCIDIFEEYGWDWTYHAFREWHGWSFEHEDLPYDKAHGVPAATPTARAQVLMQWFERNRSGR